jgi:ubiquinone/menaquinone biosynthesis C-methylase UbiE
METILRCPHCFDDKIEFQGSYIACMNCKSCFDLYNNKPILVNNEHKRDNYGKILVTKSEESFSNEAKWTNDFINLIPKGEGYLLDYACGGGAKNLCEKKGYKYVGVDYYNDYGVDVIAHGENLPFKNNTFSVVTSSAVMEHIPNPWLACKEIFRVLKPQGYYIGSTAFLYPYHERSHYNMSHLGVKVMLEQAGFEVIDIIPWKFSGFEAFLKCLVGFKFLNIFVYPMIWTIKLLFYFRKLAMLIFRFIYNKDENKKARIIEYIEEDKLRFTSGFTYLAYKK